MITSALSTRTVQETALADLMGRLGAVLRGMERACAGVQDQLGAALQPGALLSTSGHEQIQELDRVTQTMDALAELFAAIESHSQQDRLDIDLVVSQVKLPSIRSQLQAGHIASPREGSTSDAELF